MLVRTITLLQGEKHDRKGLGSYRSHGSFNA